MPELWSYTYYQPLTAYRTFAPTNPHAPTLLLLYSDSSTAHYTAETLALAGWQVLLADPTDHAFIAYAADNINLTPDHSHQAWLSISAIITPTQAQPDYIALLNLAPAIPRIVYPVAPTSDGSELLPILAELTSIIYCADCKALIKPQEKALLSNPYLYCQRCAYDIAAVPRQALFPARLLARAARVFTDTHPYEPVLTLTDPWN